MNKVILIGRLTKDPDMTNSSNGNAITKFSIAVDRKFADKDGNKITDFFSCVSFGKKAETIYKYVKKGHKIYIEGELWNNNYENEKGEKKNFTNICVDTIEFLEKKSGDVATETPPELTEIEDDDSLPF